MSDIECEAETLGEQKFRCEDIFRFCATDGVGEFGEFEVVVLGFCGEEEGGFEDVGGVVGHEGVGYVEPF